jgi:DNA processing protein
MRNDDLLYNIALTKVEKVGSIIAKNLISYCGDAKTVFQERKSHLVKIPQIGHAISDAIKDPAVFQKAEKEIQYIQKNNIRVMFYLHEDYPFRLKQYSDSPVLLYYLGNADLNHDKILAVVGTRRMTEYGRELVTQLIKGISDYNILVVSGLAYGVDSLAHKLCVQESISTVGVLAHGLDRIYPNENKKLSIQMQEQGGLLTEFGINTQPDRENFPMRNRIVAGICDAVIVVETKNDGGSMITAEIANNYNKDVFAYPGKVQDIFSAGCHSLIKNHKASLIENATDLITNMSWDTKQSTKPVQQKLFIELTEEEKTIMNILITAEEIHVDRFYQQLEFSPGKLAGLLLNMEFNGIIKSLPGKRYAKI